MIGKFAEIKLGENLASVESVFAEPNLWKPLVHPRLTSLKPRVVLTTSTMEHTFVTSATILTESGAWSSSNALPLTAGSGIVPNCTNSKG